MKLKCAAIAVCAMLLLSANVSAEEMKTFGIGVILGKPTGITAKYKIDHRLAVDAGVGWKTSGDDEFYTYADVLYHLHDVIVVKKGKLPLYLGAGLRYVNRDKDDDKFGIRIPIGAEYLFDGLPLGAFAEIAPVLNLSPDTDVDLEGGIGIRFYF